MKRFADLVVPLLLSTALLTSCSDDGTDPMTPSDDTTTPTVVATTPVQNAVDVATDSVISFVFSEAMDQDSAQGNVTSQGTPSSGLIWSDARTLQVQFFGMPGDTDLDVTLLTGLTDLAGNGLAAPFVLNFRTESPIPTFLGSLPADNATGVVRNAPVRLQFSRDMDLSGLSAAITATTPSAASAVLGFTLAAVEQHGVMMTFDEPLPANTVVSVDISTAAYSFDGYPLDQAVAFSFTTGNEIDTTAPTLLSISPENGSSVPATTAAIEFTFDEAIDPATFEPDMLSAQFSLFFDQSGAEVTWSADGTRLTVPLAVPLPPGMPIAARFDSYADLAGNVQAVGIDYRIDVEGPGDPWPFADGVRFEFDVDETITPPGDSPFQSSYTEFIQVNEQGNGDLRWTTYESGAYAMALGYDVYRRTATEVRETGWYWNEGGEVDQGTITPGAVWAKLPFTVQSWSGSALINTPDGSLDATYDVAVVGREDVPSILEDGGTEFVWLDCWKVTRAYTLTSGGAVVGSGTGTYWYAPNVGVVRSEMSETEEDATTYVTIQDLANVSF